MKTIRDFINLVEADEIDPSKVVVDQPAPAPAANPDMAARLQAAVSNEEGIKMVPLTPVEIKKFQDLFRRMDAILVKYTKDKKPFESVDFESMTESEQRQYIMQNLHLLSEADQMAVLRSITNEGKAKIAGDIAKYGIENIGIPLVKGIYNAGEKVAGKAWNAGSAVVGKLFDRIVAPALQLGMVAGGSVYAWNHWSEIFPPSPALDRMITPEDRAELDRLGTEAEEGILVKLPQGYSYAYPKELTTQMGAMQVRYTKLIKAAEEMARTPATPATSEPGIVDLATDKLKSLLKK